MSTATVTYHELPPIAAWAVESGFAPIQDGSAGNGVSLTSFLDPNAHSLIESPSSWINAGYGADASASMHGAGELNSIANGAFELSNQNGMATSGHWSPLCAPGAAPAPMAISGQPPPYVSSAAVSVYPARSPLYASPSSSKKRPSGVRPPIQTAVSGNPAPEELCLVCGDKASGYHYNALTCEGCKGFFRRSITRKAVYYCKYGGHCDIDMYMRRKCQCCRLRKCMDIGMRPELVVPEETCRVKREAKMKLRRDGAAPGQEERKANCSPQQQVTSTETTVDAAAPPHAPALTPEQRELVHRLVVYQQQYDMPSNDALSKLSTFSDGSSQQTQPFQHLAELTILTVQLIVEFTKHLPGFLTLTKDDQLTLLKACSTEVLMLRTARRYDSKTDTIVLGNQSTSWAYSRQAYKQAGIGSATDAIFDFAKSITKIRVDNAEYALLTAVAIFSDRPGLQEARKVEDIQEVYTSTLQSYIDVHRPNNRAVFARLLMKLTDLRTLGCEHADMLCALKLDTNVASQPQAFDGAEPAQTGSEPVQQPGSTRVPNVRIKVEPLNSLPSISSEPNGMLMDGQYFPCNGNASAEYGQPSNYSLTSTNAE